MQLEVGVQKLIAETVLGEEPLGSLSLSNLQEVKECLEREQGCIDKISRTYRRLSHR